MEDPTSAAVSPVDPAMLSDFVYSSAHYTSPDAFNPAELLPSADHVMDTIAAKDPAFAGIFGTVLDIDTLMPQSTLSPSSPSDVSLSPVGSPAQVVTLPTGSEPSPLADQGQPLPPSATVPTIEAENGLTEIECQALRALCRDAYSKSPKTATSIVKKNLPKNLQYKEHKMFIRKALNAARRAEERKISQKAKQSKSTLEVQLYDHQALVVAQHNILLGIHDQLLKHGHPGIMQHLDAIKATHSKALNASLAVIGGTRPPASRSRGLDDSSDDEATPAPESVAAPPPATPDVSTTELVRMALNDRAEAVRTVVPSLKHVTVEQTSPDADGVVQVDDLPASSTELQFTLHHTLPKSTGPLELAVLATRTPAEASQSPQTAAVRHSDRENNLWVAWDPSKEDSINFSVPVPAGADLGDTLTAVVIARHGPAGSHYSDPRPWSKVCVETVIVE